MEQSSSRLAHTRHLRGPVQKEADDVSLLYCLLTAHQRLGRIQCIINIINIYLLYPIQTVTEEVFIWAVGSQCSFMAMFNISFLLAHSEFLIFASTFDVLVYFVISFPVLSTSIAVTSHFNVCHSSVGLAYSCRPNLSFLISYADIVDHLSVEYLHLTFNLSVRHHISIIVSLIIGCSVVGLRRIGGLKIVKIRKRN